MVMDKENNQSKEFMQSFIKEVQTQQLDPNPAKIKNHKKRKIIITASIIVVIFVMVTIIILISLKQSNNRVNVSNTTVHSKEDDTSNSKQSNDYFEEIDEPPIDEESQPTYQYWEVYDMVANANDYQAEEKIIDEYFDQKAAILDKKDISSNILLMSEKALVLSYHGNQDRAKATIRLAASNMNGASLESRLYVCSSISMISAESEDATFVNNYEEICKEVRNEKNN
jgi:cytoskeletal protein RodZ